MSIYLRIILVVISMLSMMNVMKRVRRFKLQIENSIFWIIFSLLLILVAVFPDPMFWLAELWASSLRQIWYFSLLSLSF